MFTVIGVSVAVGAYMEKDRGRVSSVTATTMSTHFPKSMGSNSCNSQSK